MSRIQHAGKHSNLYYKDKEQMFQRAYRPELRDWRFFYNQVIIGLTNAMMRDELRRFRPQPLDNAQAFRDELVFAANVVRKAYANYEISKAEVLGAEAFDNSASYLNYQATLMGQTPAERMSMGYSGINALAPRKEPLPGKCHHC